MKSFKPTSDENDKVKHIRFLGLCKSCGICISKCPVKCLRFSQDKIGYYALPAIDVDINVCIGCGLCERSCPEQAITVEKKASRQGSKQGEEDRRGEKSAQGGSAPGGKAKN